MRRELRLQRDEVADLASVAIAWTHRRANEVKALQHVGGLGFSTVPWFGGWHLNTSRTAQPRFCPPLDFDDDPTSGMYTV